MCLFSDRSALSIPARFVMNSAMVALLGLEVGLGLGLDLGVGIAVALGRAVGFTTRGAVLIVTAQL